MMHLFKRISYAIAIGCFSFRGVCAESVEESLLPRFDGPISRIQQLSDKPADLQIPPPKVLPPSRKSPELAAGLSSLFPGLGHYYLGDVETASVLFGSACAGAGLVVASLCSEAFAREAGAPSVIALSTTIEYGIYAAYRDARMLNGQKGYSYRMPIDSLGDLMSASFERSIIKKPEVWGGLLGCFALAVGTSYLFYPGGAEIKMSLVSRMGSPWIAFPIAVREESLFRGFLQSTLTEATNPWGGIALSSLLFGAAHIGNAQRLPKEHQWRYYAFSLPLITTLGAYFGWITHKNCSLKESVAVHAWYDFTLFAADLLARQVGAIDQTGFAMDIPF